MVHAKRRERKLPVNQLTILGKSWEGNDKDEDFSR
jgi:hypothetical protein